MTDQVLDQDVAQTPEQIQVNPVPNYEKEALLTAEQVEAIKKNLITDLDKKYHGFIHQVQAIHCHPQARAEAFRAFDTGYLWFKEAITCLPPQAFKVQTAVISPQPEAEAQQAPAQEAPQAPETNEPSQPVEPQAA